jgi:hypothetical protein
MHPFFGQQRRRTGEQRDEFAEDASLNYISE